MGTIASRLRREAVSSITESSHEILIDILSEVRGGREGEGEGGEGGGGEGGGLVINILLERGGEREGLEGERREGKSTVWLIFWSGKFLILSILSSFAFFVYPVGNAEEVGWYISSTITYWSG